MRSNLNNNFNKSAQFNNMHTNNMVKLIPSNILDG